jgi:hypothetical protein
MSGSTTDNNARSCSPSTSKLWAQVFHKAALETPSVSSVNPVQLPPIAPVDKMGTSVRILLHDTQRNFEKFSETIEGLTEGIRKTKEEIVNVKKMFEKEHECVSEDIFNLGEWNILLGVNIPT